MQSLVIFIQRTLLWLISVVLTAIVGFFGGAFFIQHLHNEAEKETEEAEDSTYLTRDYNAKTSKNWSNDPEVNRLFLRTAENYINDTLRQRGHVFLNDVYDQLGMTRTSHGAIAGWLFTDNTLIAFTPRELKSDDNITLEFDYHGVIYNRLVVLD